jgi:cytochrome c551/c552
VEARDPEQEPLNYTWNFGNGEKLETKDPEVSYTYKTPGDYQIYAEVKDPEGASIKSEELHVYAGNQQPIVSIDIVGNQSFYFPGKEVEYKVSVSDEDTAYARPPNGLYISADYLEGFDKAAAPLGHQQAMAAATGEGLMMSYDCKTCHKVAGKSIGPAFTLVGAKYPDNPQSSDYLINKIRKGGGGVWGETTMAGHPNISQSDVTTIVHWVLSLGKKVAVKPSLSSSGSLKPSLGKTENDKAALVISASFTDKGGPGIKPLTGTNSVALKSANLNFNRVKRMKDFDTDDEKGIHYMTTTKTEGWFSIDHIDLSGIIGADLLVGYEKSPLYGYVFELRLDGRSGTLLGSADLLPDPKNNKPNNFVTLKYKFSLAVSGYHDLYVIAIPKDEKEKQEMRLGALKLLIK